MTHPSINAGLSDGMLAMPAEWNRHEATWICWPHNVDTWPNNLGKAQQEFVAMVKTIAQGETVFVVAQQPALADAQRELAGIANIEFVDLATNDSWIRDYGPVFVVNLESSTLEIVSWKYNGWGEKYPPFHDDAKVADSIAQLHKRKVWNSELVIEGGAIEVNDDGQLLTTESCLLNENRNGRSRLAEIEKSFDALLGKQCVWLPGKEIPGDDTDGHIDQQARFVNDQVVLLAQASNQSLEFSKAKSRLEEAGLDVVPFPMPPTTTAYGNILPASYLNFYFCNAALVVPQFGQREPDERALGLLREFVDDREVVGLPSVELACGLGSFHCLTQQQPGVD